MCNSNKSFVNIEQSKKFGTNVGGLKSSADIAKISNQTMRQPKHKNFPKYQHSHPDYLRVSPEHLDRKKINHPERISVLCKQNGWLTVDSQTLDRSQAYEKQSVSVNLRETSPTSPSWMQNVNHLKRDDDGYRSLQKKNVYG